MTELAEERIREIVREEIMKYMREQSIKKRELWNKANKQAAKLSEKR